MKKWSPWSKTSKTLRTVTAEHQNKCTGLHCMLVKLVLLNRCVWANERCPQTSFPWAVSKAAFPIVFYSFSFLIMLWKSLLKFVHVHMYIWAPQENASSERTESGRPCVPLCPWCLAGSRPHKECSIRAWWWADELPSHAQWIQKARGAGAGSCPLPPPPPQMVSASAPLLLAESFAFQLEQWHHQTCAVCPFGPLYRKRISCRNERKVGCLTKPHK